MAVNSQGRPSPQAGRLRKVGNTRRGITLPGWGWLTYTVSRVDEITEVRVRRLNRDTTIVLPNGSAPVFTANSQWLAYTIGGSPAQGETLEKEKKPVRSSTGIVELSNGRARRRAIGVPSIQRGRASRRHRAYPNRGPQPVPGGHPSRSSRHGRPRISRAGRDGKATLSANAAGVSARIVRRLPEGDRPSRKRFRTPRRSTSTAYQAAEKLNLAC